MRKRTLWALLGVVLLLIGLGGAYFFYSYHLGQEAAGEMEKLLTSFEGARVTFIQLRRDDGTSQPDNAVGRRLQGNWTIVLEKPLAPTSLEHFRDITTNPWTYSDTTLMCFNPGMALVFEGEYRRLEVVICLECSRMLIFKNGVGQGGRWFLSRRGNEQLYDFYNSLTRQQ